MGAAFANNWPQVQLYDNFEGGIFNCKTDESWHQTLATGEKEDFSERIRTEEGQSRPVQNMARISWDARGMIYID